MRYWDSLKVGAAKRTLKKLTRRLHLRYIPIRTGTPRLRRHSRRSARHMRALVILRRGLYMMREGPRRIYPDSINRDTISNIRNLMKTTFSICSLAVVYTVTCIIDPNVEDHNNNRDKHIKRVRKETQLKF